MRRHPIIAWRDQPASGPPTTYGGWIADAAKKGIRLIGIDRPGYGGSTAQPGYTVASHAHDVRVVAEALGYDRIGIWGISGGGPYALGRAALLPDVVVAAAAVASVAPYGVEGFDFLDGMGESNVEAFQLFFSDPEASRLICVRAARSSSRPRRSSSPKAWKPGLARRRRGPDRGPAPMADRDPSGGCFPGRSLLLSAQAAPVGYAVDRIGDLSPTPATGPIGVDGVADRWRLGSVA